MICLLGRGHNLYGAYAKLISLVEQIVIDSLLGTSVNVYQQAYLKIVRYIFLLYWSMAKINNAALYVSD